MTSSAKSNNPRSLISPSEGGGAGKVLNKVLYEEGQHRGPTTDPFNHIYILFLTEKVSLKET